LEKWSNSINSSYKKYVCGSYGAGGSTDKVTIAANSQIIVQGTTSEGSARVTLYVNENAIRTASVNQGSIIYDVKKGDICYISTTTETSKMCRAVMYAVVE